MLFQPVRERKFERQELAGAKAERVVDNAGELRFPAIRAASVQELGLGALSDERLDDYPFHQSLEPERLQILCALLPCCEPTAHRRAFSDSAS